VAGRLRLDAFRLRCQVAAALARASFELDLAPGALVGRGVRISFFHGTRNRLSIASGARLGDDSYLSFRGGELTIGPGTDVRRSFTANITGRLEIGQGVVISNHINVHCHEHVTVGDLTIVGERTTIADSNHQRTPDGVPVHHSVKAAPVHIGANVWVGANSIITAGVTVGDMAFIGGCAVVTRDVKPGWLAAGNPAVEVRELRPIDVTQG
jgi:acetyltransferase-like isoleucine patch superfamily enzyme